MLLSSDELINCAVSLNGYLDLRHRAFPLGGRQVEQMSRRMARRMLETVCWLLCDETQQVRCPRG